MKIFDCFTFYNEFELLELRLQELYDHVDYFVITEADLTFQNQPKPLYLTENYHKFSKWHDKIILIPVTDMPTGDDPWSREEHQRNAIMRGLENADAQDMIIISDIDEIPRPETIDKVRENDPSYDFYAFYMPLFQFRINYMVSHPAFMECWGQAVRRCFLDELSPEFIRKQRFYCHSWPNATVVQHAGWHFSWWAANDSTIKEKLQSFSHAECNTPENLSKVNLERTLREGTSWNPDEPTRNTSVALDQYFPKTIVENLAAYNHAIVQGSFSSVTEIIS